MVIGHSLLNYPNPFQPSVSLYWWLSQGRIAVRPSGNKEINGVKRTNMGLMKTIGEGAECLGITSSQMPTI
jgi:hypothetical protein